MRRDVVTISPDASIVELIQSLRTHEIGGMPVTREDGTALGMVSSTDLLWLADGEARNDDAPGFLPQDVLSTRRVRDIMTPDVLAVSPETGMADLRRFFTRHGVQRALVVEDDRIVGIVVLSDVLGTLVP
jgi:CBS domain-containing protein